MSGVQRRALVDIRRLEEQIRLDTQDIESLALAEEQIELDRIGAAGKRITSPRLARNTAMVGFSTYCNLA